MSRFFQCKQFLVVGASQDRSKFGNKVLRCYLQNNKKAIPINKKSKEIEGIECIPSLTDYVSSLSSAPLPFSLEDVGVSIITPPGVTNILLQEGKSLGIKNFFLQPGTHDGTTTKLLSNDWKDINVEFGCVLVYYGFSD